MGCAAVVATIIPLRASTPELCALTVSLVVRGELVAARVARKSVGDGLSGGMTRSTAACFGEGGVGVGGDAALVGPSSTASKRMCVARAPVLSQIVPLRDRCVGEETGAGT
jgi:hypothetical protein